MDSPLASSAHSGILPFMFKDRQDAGRLLLAELEKGPLSDPLVLALPRGGVLVGWEIASELQAEFDVLIVRKLGAPRQPELAIGAVVDGSCPQTILNHRLIESLEVSPDYLKQEIQAQLKEVGRRKEKYRGRRAPARIEGRTVIVVDDGIATGATVRASLAALRLGRASRLVLAVPVAPPDALAGLRDEVDSIACLAAPPDFQAVGQFYEDFHPVSDEQVIQCLNDAWKRGASRTRSTSRPRS
jgi:putative phosphoribosyl transferase